MSTPGKESDKRRQDRQRAEIVEFCRLPRTLAEIKEGLGIGGISASAYLTALHLKGLCRYNPKTKRYRCPTVRAATRSLRSGSCLRKLAAAVGSVRGT